MEENCIIIIIIKVHASIVVAERKYASIIKGCARLTTPIRST